jgi:hemerythrin-like domain-containing protein
MREHRLIERMLKVAEGRVEGMRRDGRGDPVFVEQVVGFVRAYADRCHHGKEEDILFRDLAGRDLDPDLRRIMEELLREHMEGRQLVRELEDANRRYKQGDQEALGQVTALLTKLASFYPLHIAKEDKTFFYPCMELFSKQEKDAMLEEFWDFDRRLIHEQNEKLVRDLEAFSQAAP